MITRTTYILQPVQLGRTSVGVGCKLVACAALSFLITLLTFTTIASSVGMGPTAVQSTALAANAAQAVPTSLRASG